MYKRNQDTCREVTRRATRDCRWKAGLYRNVDFVALRGRIIAYQIRWFNGRWSGWFVPGINDADGKFNPYRGRCSLRLEAKSMRRVWSYFYDHEHKFILCS
ncbi:hypothetical protein FSP39_021867 [Pinctada imbricata]|uniref:Uncharacterized protein n=1 Tax=Pinctada imbricata TaxID=66713 RepID=A0AA88YHP8_PINIB|nr:hypothetical protein FSP39_021867 [Pinctada imbricata]